MPLGMTSGRYNRERRTANVVFHGLLSIYAGNISASPCGALNNHDKRRRPRL